MTTETEAKPRKRELSGRVYTMADKPAGVHPDLWQMAIDQRTVESSRGEHLLSLQVDVFESDEEFEEFQNFLRASREIKG